MKTRLLALILAFSILFGILSGCSSAGQSSSDSGSEGTSPAAADSPTDPAVSSDTDTESTGSSDADAHVPTVYSADGQTKTITLSNGKEVTFPTEVDRIAVLFGPSYEKIALLGAEDKVVCISDMHQTNWPWATVIYKRVMDSSLGLIANASTALNAEDVYPYDVDVAFNWDNEKTTSALENIGIAVMPYAGTNDIGSVKNELYEYAEVLGGNSMERAEKYAAYFDEKLAMVTDIVSQIPEAERKTVHFGMRKILATSGNQSDLPALVEAAGGICVESDLDAGNVDITKEQLLSWNPEYIFIDHAGARSDSAPPEQQVAELLESDDFSGIKAVQDGNVYIAPTGVFFWDAGVQDILLVMWMAKIMYPDYFEDLDIKAELVTFYHEFFDYDLTDAEAEKIMTRQNP